MARKVNLLYQCPSRHHILIGSIFSKVNCQMSSQALQSISWFTLTHQQPKPIDFNADIDIHLHWLRTMFIAAFDRWINSDFKLASTVPLMPLINILASLCGILTDLHYRDVYGTESKSKFNFNFMTFSHQKRTVRLLKIQKQQVRITKIIFIIYRCLRRSIPIPNMFHIL